MYSVEDRARGQRRTALPDSLGDVGLFGTSATMFWHQELYDPVFLPQGSSPAGSPKPAWANVTRFQPGARTTSDSAPRTAPSAMFGPGAHGVPSAYLRSCLLEKVHGSLLMAPLL